MNELAVVEVKQKEEEFVRSIVESKGANLPGTIDEIVNVFEFTDFKARAWKILAQKTSKLEEQAELHQAAIRSGQQWGIAALYAQKRIGEITREMTETNEYGIGGVSRKRSKPETGLSYRGYADAERIAANPEILEEVIESAKKHGEIPTKTAVLNTIRSRNVEKNNRLVKEKHDKKRVEQVDDAVKQYFDSIKGFKSAIEYAIIDANGGKFAQESINILKKKHAEVKSLFEKLEASI